MSSEQKKNLLSSLDYWLYIRKNRRRSAWNGFVRFMACLVVFCTTYALILPAITLEADAYCAMEEHSHSEDCYVQETATETAVICAPAHVHTSDCYNAAGALVCQIADYVLHTHDALCYNAVGSLICHLPEIKEHVHTAECYTAEKTVPGHAHDGSCFTTERQEQTCQLEETAAHTHTETCSTSTLICATEFDSHVHGTVCYESTLTCTAEEGADHTHGESCYTAALACTTEYDAHVHSDGCYETALSCATEETEGHTHTDSCFITEQVLSCVLEETAEITRSEPTLICKQDVIEAHTHTDACRAANCGKLQVVKHTHTQDCLEILEANPTLVCQHSEHIHNLACYSNPEADLETRENWERALRELELDGTTAENFLAVADTQLGYQESNENYAVVDGSAYGYNRYGVWAGDAYANWNELFVAFCLHYAGIKEKDFPRASDAEDWMQTLSGAGMLAAKDYTPVPSDLVFFEEKLVSYVGIVSEVREDGQLTVIVGDYEDAVSAMTLSENDEQIRILGFAILPELEEAKTEATEPETTEPVTTEPASTEPEVTEPASTEPEVTEPEITEPEVTEPEVTEPEVTEPRILSASMSFELDTLEPAATFARGRATLYAARAITAAARASSNIDMTGMITDVKVYHKTTGWGDTWKELVSPNIVKNGDLLRFGIVYEVPGNTLSPDNNTISYQLPITGITEAKSGIVTNENGEEVGTYTISETGLIEIEFHEYYVAENANGVVISGTINFDSTAEKLDTDHDGKIDLEFTDSEKVEVNIEQTIQNDLTVTKTAGTPSDDGTINYTITVSSKNGTKDAVVLSDWMSNVTYLSGFQVLKNGTDITSDVDNPNTGDTSIAMTLPQMNPGDSYTITYTGVVSNVSGGTATAGNGVTVTSKDDNGNTLTDSADVRVDYSKDILDKSYLITSNGKVNWTITVGAANQDLGGWQLSDIVNGAPLQETVNIQYGNQTISTKLPYTFPEGAVGPAIVTYTTNLDYNLGANSMSNTATLTPPTNNNKPVHSDSQNVQDPHNTATNYPLNKEANGMTVTDKDGNNKEAVINWSYEINSSLGSVYTSQQSDGEYWYFQDELSNPQYFTDAQKADLEAAIKAAMIAAFNDPTVYNVAKWNEDNVVHCESNPDGLYEIQWLPTWDPNGKTGFRVKVYQNMLKGTKISFAYSSTVEFNGANSQHFQNNANINNKTYDSGAVDYNPVITKMDGSNGSTSGTTHAKQDLTDGILTWKIQMTLPEGSKDVTIIEALPDMVDLVSITLANSRWTDNSKTLNISGDTPISGWNHWDGSSLGEGNVTVAKKEGSNDYTISFDEKFAATTAGQTLIFTVTTKLNESFGFDGTTTENGYEITVLENNVTVKYKDSNSTEQSGSDSHKQTITNEDTTQQLVKTAGKYAESKIPYTLAINPNAKDLGEGDTLTISDRFSFTNYEGDTFFNATLQDVVVYSVDQDGKKTQLTLANSAEAVTPESKNYYYTYVQSEEHVTWHETLYYVYNDIVFTVPDNTHLSIEYKYFITGVEGQQTTFSNTATLREVSQNGSDKKDSWLQIEEAGATAELNSITIYKVDKNNYNNHLIGAEFELYKWNADTGKWEFEEIVKSDGSDLELTGLTINQAYFLIETKAPSGYVLDQSRQYFMLYDPTKASVTAPDDFPSSAYYTRGRNIYITNEKAGTQISARKQWKDASGNDITAPADARVEFQLMQVRSSYPHDFDTSTIGNNATVSLAFGHYSSDTNVFGPEYISAHIGDIITVTLKTPNNSTAVSDGNGGITDAPYPPGLMEITNSANTHLPYTSVDNGNDTWTYTFQYLVKSTNANLRGWVYPENKDASVSYSIKSYTETTDTTTTEQVYQNGGTVTLDSGSGWKHTWYNLPSYELDDNGQIKGYYSYYVKETKLSGYSESYSTDTDGTLVVTNRQVETMELKVQKQWVDPSNQLITDTSKLPTITVNLYQVESTYSGNTATTGGTLYGTYTLSHDSWQQTINVPKTGVDAYGNIVYYSYYFQEEVPSGYDVSYSTDGNYFSSALVPAAAGSTTTIRNKDNETYAVEVEKNWVNSNDNPVNAPQESITFELNKQDTNGNWVSQGTYTLSNANQWKQFIENLTAGKYKIKETSTGNFTVSYTANGNQSSSTDGVEFNLPADNNQKVSIGITNQVEDETVNIPVTKLWFAADGSAITPAETEIQFYLLQNGTRMDADKDSSNGITPYTLTAANNWSMTIYGLPKQDNNGNEYTYAVEEVNVPDGYKVSYSGDSTNGLIITNTKLMSLTVRKTWTNADGETRDALAKSIKFNLYKVDGDNQTLVSSSPFTIEADKNWEFTLDNLEPGTYRIEEVGGNPLTGYIQYSFSSSAGGSSGDTAYIAGNMGSPTFTINNFPYMNVTVDKKWNGTPIDGLSVDVQLYRVKSTQPGPVTFNKDDTNTTTPLADKTATLDASNGWHKTFKNLPMYGYEENTLYYYTYYVVETTTGYVADYSPHNTLDQTGSIVITNDAASLQVTKAWKDQNNQDLTNVPDSISFQIIQSCNGQDVVYDPNPNDGIDEPTFTLTAADNWDKTFAGLPIKDAQGNTYTYTVKEIETEDGYISTVTNSSNGNAYKSDIVNTDEGTTEISVEKVWKGISPDNEAIGSIQAQLYRFESTTNPGEIIGTSLKTETPVWVPTFDISDGTYDNSDGSDTFILSNLHTAWNGNFAEMNATDNHDGTTTYSHTYYKNGDFYGCIKFVITVPDAYYTIGGKDGVKNLRVTIDGVDRSSDLADKLYLGPQWDDSIKDFGNNLLIEWFNVWTLKYDNNFTFNNNITVSFTLPTRPKVNVYDQVEPENMHVKETDNGDLVWNNNGTMITGVAIDPPVTLSNNNAWQNEWTNLPQYGKDANGNTVYYTYYVKELGPDIYDTHYSVSDPITSGIIGITNSEKFTSYTVTKEWRDQNGNPKYDHGVNSIEVQLQRDGVDYGEKVTLNGGNNWTYYWNNLPMYNFSTGNAYGYSVKEVTVPNNYTVTYDGNKIINTYQPDSTSITVNKEWANGTNPADNVQVQLIQVATEQEAVTTNHVMFSGSAKHEPSNESWWFCWMGPLTEYALTEGGYFTVYYTANSVGLNLILQGASGYGEISPVSTENIDGQYVATYSYQDCVAKYGSDLSTVTQFFVSGDRNNNITVTKVTWTSVDTTEGGTGSVTESAYQNPVTLNDGNGWTHTWNSLPKEGVLNGKSVTYTYYVKELTEGYDVTYSDNNGNTTTNDPKELATQSGTIKVTNSATETEPISFTVNKQWKDMDGNPLTFEQGKEPTVKFYLKDGDKTLDANDQDSLVPTPYELGYNNGTWSITIENLPQPSSANGYTVEEIQVFVGSDDVTKYYTPSYSYTNDTEATITNTYTGTDIGVEKEWAAGTTPAPVTFYLYQITYYTRPTGEIAKPDVVNMTPFKQVTLHAEENSKDVVPELVTADSKTWKGLPLMGTENGQTVYYSYYVQEAPNEFIPTYSTDKPITKGTVTVTNAIATTDITVNKQWFNSTGADISANPPAQEIEFEIWRSAGDSDPEIFDTDPNTDGKTIKLTAEDNWTKTVTGLPKCNANGVEYVYTVKEVTVVPGYTPDVTEDTANGFVITNTQNKPTSLIVHKKWVNAGTTTNLPEIQFEVREVTDSGPTEEPTEEPTEDPTTETEESTGGSSTKMVTFEACITASKYGQTFPLWTQEKVEYPINSVITIVLTDLWCDKGKPVISATGLTYVPSYIAADPYYPEKDHKDVYTYTITLDQETNVFNATINITGHSAEWPDWSYSFSGPDNSASYAVSGRSSARGTPITGTLNASNNWTCTVDGLDPNKTYIVVETGSSDSGLNYSVSYTVNGQTSSTCPEVAPGESVTIVNTLASYELPSTGGKGVEPMLYAGAVMFLGAAYLLYADRKRRKRKA